MLTVDISLPDVEELHKLVADGVEKGFLTYDEIVVGHRGSGVDEGAGRGLLHVSHRSRRSSSWRASSTSTRRTSSRPPEEEKASEARPDGRAVARLAPALPARDRQGAAAHRRSGGLSRQAHRARRHAREDADDRGEPAARRLDREGVPRPRPVVPRPDPGRARWASSARSRSSTTARATSSRRTRRGGSARR